MTHQHNPSFPAISDVLPHRPPHLWLDGVTDLGIGVGAQGFWTPPEEHFAGHFEGMPLLPGIKQVESLAQLGAYAMMADSEQPQIGIFKGIKDVKFLRPVRPGKTLDLAIQITDKDRHDFQGQGTAEVEGAVTCEAIIIGSLLSVRTTRRLLGNS